MINKLLFFFSLLTTVSFAQTFDVGGIYYNIKNSTEVEVGDNPRFTGVANIPSTVNYNTQNYTVTSISGAAFALNTDLTSVTIPNLVTSIGDFAFLDCSSLTSVNFPAALTSIGENAFNGCHVLSPSNSLPNTVTSIGQGAFRFCNALTSFNIPNSITSIESITFEDCYGLTSITIPNSVTSIGEGAFGGCGFTSITIPNSVTSIGNYAFAGCSKLTSVEIPSSITAISDYLFSHCFDHITNTGLTSVTIPSSVTSIGEYAFSQCYGLTTVNCYAQTPPTLGVYAFFQVNQPACTLNVNDAAAVTAYEDEDVWTDFNPINGTLANDSFIKNNFSIYPNPSNGMVNISLENNLQLEKVTIYNQLGQVVKTATTNVITTSDLAKGSYYVEIITNEGKATKQLLIQ